ncbi:MAG: GNAT family N-acetyltransferase [Armatimonadetes bacterium]|nr:GNAT family N-acetyltransferase [Armatimonadota bacterium]NIM23894.1 GNAT family N-acetyltransferase [Armatimonadota bacterium]NIM66613.1 GNAT family N-acetyltransferase [Armatimonadota bacterium]NIM76281.1 GNAT family N-acetyltransferase [Armatimonadota bacterium]NIN05975.1 GNAT family N-acetyltransferase [Armatimonadota bacterium]
MADYEAVAELWGIGKMEIDPPEQVRQRMKRDRDLLLVAELKGKPIGSVIGGWDGRRASVWRLVVHPDFQRRGVAQALLREVEKRLRAKGALSVFLLTWHKNDVALRLYHSCGYHLCEGIVFMYKDCPKRRKGSNTTRRRKSRPEE